MKTKEDSVNSLGAIPSGPLRKKPLKPVTASKGKKMNQANEVIALCNKVTEAQLEPVTHDSFDSVMDRWQVLKRS